jgi:phosphoglycerol transferase MdoB-like AlkP superfamily enzyme
MKQIMQSRFGLVILLMLIFMGIALVTRVVLLGVSFSLVDFNIFSLLKLFLAGSLYDLLAAIYLVAPFAIYTALAPNRLFNNRFHKYLIWFFLFMQTYFITFGIFSEYFFWDEFGKRFNFIAVDYLVYTTEVIHNILESYPVPLLLSIVLLISIAIFLSIYKKTSVLQSAFASEYSYKEKFTRAVLYLLAPVLIFNIFNEQGLSKTSQNQYNNELSKNGLYSLFSAFRNNSLPYDEFYKTRDIKVVMQDLKSLSGFDDKSLKIIQTEGKEKQYNIMLILVESLSAEYMGVFGDTKNLTPKLDALAKESLFFNNFYATGTRTVRGMEAITLSVPPTPGRSIVKRPDNFNMYSTGFISQEKGYDNKFIYAGHGYFDNMNSFFSHNGFEIVDRTEFEEEEISFANVWGVCDEDLFNKALKESDKSYAQKKPFFNLIMTTTNHRPFTYPNGKIDIPSHTGRAGAVKYTDYAIAKFIEDSKNKPWFKNTIFVVVADHNAGSAGETSLPVWRYKIPFFLYAPDILKPQVVSKLSSQIDLMPTLFSLMNWSYKSKFYGEDILADKFQERAFIGTYQKLGYLTDKKLLILEPNKSSYQYELTKEGLRSTEYKEIEVDKKDESDAITFYQSSSYLYEHKLNRYTKE